MVDVYSKETQKGSYAAGRPGQDKYGDTRLLLYY